MKAVLGENWSKKCGKYNCHRKVIFIYLFIHLSIHSFIPSFLIHFVGMANTETSSACVTSISIDIFCVFLKHIQKNKKKIKKEIVKKNLRRKR